MIIEVEDERNGVVGLLWLLQEACFFFFLKREGSLSRVWFPSLLSNF